MASNAIKLASLPLEDSYHGFPASRIKLSDEHFDRYKKYTSVKIAYEALEEFFVMRGPVPIPRELTNDPHYGTGPTDRFGTAQSKPVSVGVRTSYGQESMGAAYSKLPKEGFEPFTQAYVREKIESKVYASGGVETSYERIRKFLRRQKEHVNLDLPTSAEVEIALASCGFGPEAMENAVAKNLDFGSENVVRANVHSSNGFPVRGTLADVVSAQQVFQLTQMIAEEFRTRQIVPLNGRPIQFNTVAQWYQVNLDIRPWLLLVEGKVKGDFYSKSKVEESLLRFYNVFPRQLMLYMQQATQGAEDAALNCLSPRVSDNYVHTAKGVTFVKGGADDMVSVMDQELREKGMAWVHAGDDTFAAISDGSTALLFSIDATSFDLTQHSAVMRPIVDRMVELLRPLHADAAELWGQMQMKRLVAMGKSLVVEMTHGGPSGSPLQSVKNDVLMEIVMMRLYDKLGALMRELGKETFVPDATVLDRCIQEVGKGLDLQLRLEDCAQVKRTDASWKGSSSSFFGIREALMERPFLFLGYYLHGNPQTGKIYPYIDIARSLAQRPFKGLKWHKSHQALQVAEAMRLGSMMMGCGIPPESLKEAHEAQRTHAVKLLKDTLGMFGDVDCGKLAWAIGESVYGGEVIPSLSGLVAAFDAERDRTLYDFMVTPMQIRLLPTPPVSLSWADEVEQEEELRRADLEKRGEVVMGPIVVKGLQVKVQPPRLGATLARAGLLAPVVPGAVQKRVAQRSEQFAKDKVRGKVRVEAFKEDSDGYSEYSEQSGHSYEDRDYETRSSWSEHSRGSGL